MMIAIIGLSAASILLLIILATCYIRQKRSPKSSHTSGSATGTSESSLPESPEEHHFTHMKQAQYEVHRPNFMYGGHLWNQHHIYPVSQQYPLLREPIVRLPNNHLLQGHIVHRIACED